MNKFIDADRLRAEIVRLKKEKPFHDDPSFLAYLHGLSKIEDFIDSLQEERPSLPSNLDEAAWGYASKECEKDAFKAGAEWMAGQGRQQATAVGKVFTNPAPKNIIVENDQWDKLLGQFDNGQRVRIILVKEDAE